MEAAAVSHDELRVSWLLRGSCSSETEGGNRSCGGFGGQPTNPETETVMGLWLSVL